jgi:16S rRNA (guanine(966)-N(2))-methyltransferase RsmD
MRVTVGKYKGQILRTPKGVKIRPSAQKLKQALFNIIGRDICGAAFLELFAGSGNIGIEALSRGAHKVFFVENKQICIKTIARNLRQLRICYCYGLGAAGVKQPEPYVVLFPLNVEKALKLLSRKHQRFNFVFLDPPYYQDQLKNNLLKISHYDILSPRSYVIAEHHRRQILPELLGELKLMFTRKYGDTVLSFYRS